MSDSLLENVNLSLVPTAYELKSKFGFREDLAENLAKFLEHYLDVNNKKLAAEMAGIKWRTVISWHSMEKTRKVIAFYENSQVLVSEDKLLQLRDQATSEDVQLRATMEHLKANNPIYSPEARREKARASSDAALVLFKQQIADQKEAKKLEQLDPFLEAEKEEENE